MFPAAYPALYDHFHLLPPYKHIGKHNCVVWPMDDSIYICFEHDLCRLAPDHILISPSAPHRYQPSRRFNIEPLVINPYPCTSDSKILRHIMKVYLASQRCVHIIDSDRSTTAPELYRRYFIDMD